MNKMLMILLVALSSLMAIGCGCTTVAPGTVGIAVGWNGVDDNIRHPGMVVYNPITTSILPMSTQTEVYEMAGQDSIHVLTQDQLSVDLEVTVSFHLNETDAVQVYTLYSADYAGRIIHPIVRTAVRDAASQSTALALVGHRDELQARMESMVHDQIVSTLSSRGLPADSFVVENVLLRNIDLPQSLDDSIAAVQQQHQATQRQLELQATATAEAESARIRAEGAARAAVAAAQGQADANRLLAQSLTPAVLESRRIELTGQLLANEHTRTIVLPSGTTPLLQMASDQ